MTDSVARRINQSHLGIGCGFDIGITRENLQAGCLSLVAGMKLQAARLALIAGCGNMIRHRNEANLLVDCSIHSSIFKLGSCLKCSAKYCTFLVLGNGLVHTLATTD